MGNSVIELTLTYKGYKIAVVWHPDGKYRCGYVLIPMWHKLYEEDYNHIDGIQCHGGLTYSGHYLLGKEYRGWWIGFDCAHAGDNHKKCNLKFCMDECRHIVDQVERMWDYGNVQ